MTLLVPKFQFYHTKKFKILEPKENDGDVLLTTVLKLKRTHITSNVVSSEYTIIYIYIYTKLFLIEDNMRKAEPYLRSFVFVFLLL